MTSVLNASYYDQTHLDAIQAGMRPFKSALVALCLLHIMLFPVTNSPISLFCGNP